MLRPAWRSPRSQRGLSLIEMMVGIAVGMFVVAAAATLVATQLSENRRLLLEVQLQQDLRASADIITRELRRAGSWTNRIAEAANGTWVQGTDPQLNTNLLDLEPVGPDPASTVRFRSSRTPGQVGPYGFALDDTNHLIKSWLSSTNTQPLTDPATIKITDLRITRVDEPPTQGICSQLCPPGPAASGPNTACWPTISVRSFVVYIAGQSVNDASVKRSITTRVRLRNDDVAFNDPLHPGKACPDPTP